MLASLHHFYRQFWPQFFLAFIAAACIITWQTSEQNPDLNAGDSYAYMFVAKDLVDTGVFTDGNFKGVATAQGEKEQGMFFAPLYPALLAGAMALDQNFYEIIACQTDLSKRAGCSHALGILLYFYIVLAVLAAFGVWLIAWVLSKNYRVAWLAMILSLIAECYAYYTAQIMTEILLFPLFTGACLSALVAYQQKRLWLWLIAGVLLGLTALTRPSFEYLFFASLPMVTLLAWRDFRMPLMFLLGYSTIVAPWVVRNGLAMDKYAISSGYASFTLVQRVSYNDMNWQEWGVSFIYGLPDFGDSLAKDLFPPESYERFEYKNPEGFYKIGNGRLREETLKAAGGREKHLAYLLKNEVIGNLGKHIITTFSLAWRGMWVSKYWGLITIPIFMGIFIMALKRRWVEFLIIAIPPWFMLGLHAFTSVNVVRYNLILVPVLSIAAAILLNAGITFIQKRLIQKME